MGRRRLVRGLAAVTAGVVPFAFGAQSADAAESHSNSSFFDHTFTAGDGRQVTCNVFGSSSLFRESSDTPFRADASTFSFSPNFPSDPACTDGFFSVSTSYLDPEGRRTRSGSSGAGGNTTWFAENVGSDFSATHSIQYFDCQANCAVSFTTRPK